jgi:hypothetical protein
MADDVFDLSKTYIHLGRGGTTIELPGFTWSAEYLRGYLRQARADGPDGRLVGIIRMDATWRHWESHTGGDEIVVQLTGASDLIQEIDGEWHRYTLTPGIGMINPRGVWHTSDVHEPGQSLFVAAGGRTIYRPRTADTPAPHAVPHEPRESQEPTESHDPA